MPKLKAFNKSEKEKIKKVILGIPILLTVIAIVIVASSYAIFQRQDEAQLIRATVGNFNNKGDILLAITVNGKEVDVPPSKNKYTVTVDCDNATGTWDSDRWGANIDNITTTNVKCNINFETPKPTLTEVTATSEKTSINLSYTAEGAGTTTTCKYGIESGSYTNTATGATNTTCSITELSPNTTYYYQVCATNVAGEVCKEGNGKTKVDFAVGDYITLTLGNPFYGVSANSTGYSTTQRVNLIELNLWRVIKKNDDGTVDVVSEYVSSTNVFFKGQTGYSKLVGTLYGIAAQYTNEKYVESTRHMKKDDTTLVENVYGTLIGKTPSGTAKDYWLATQFSDRFCPSTGSCTRRWGGLYVRSSDGEVSKNTLRGVQVDSETEYSECAAIRPILTLKSTVDTASGNGTASSPYELS